MKRSQWVILATASMAGAGCLFLGDLLGPSPGRLEADSSRMEWKLSRLKPVHEEKELGPSYLLTNRGGRPVRITSIESGCGCTTPKAESKLVPPGGASRVFVNASAPVVGARTIAIVVNTDSELTPRIPLQLEIIDDRRPPYVVSVTGDLSYTQSSSFSDPRLIVVHSIEPTVNAADGPTLRSALPMTFHLQKREAKPRVDNPGVSNVLTYFEVRWTSPPRHPKQFGSVQMMDPWGGQDREVAVSVDIAPDVIVSPSRLVLFAGESVAGQSPAKQLLVRSAQEGSEVSIEVEDPDRGPLIVEEIPHDMGPGQDLFLVRLKDGKDRGGVWNLLVKVKGSSTNPVVVPVLVRKGAGG